MTDFLLQGTASNIVLASTLAGVAWVVGCSGKRPFIAHMLWVLVLLKLLTPPILTLTFTLPSMPWEGAALSPAAGPAPLVADNGPLHAMAGKASPMECGAGLLLLWCLGSLSAAVISLHRIVRFNRLLQEASANAPSRIQRIASALAQKLGPMPTPQIYTTSARLSPMVWWTGGQVRIVIPEYLCQSEDSLRFILAHELAHVQRRDYLVRWLEWLARIVYWWNPLVWWAQRNLRIHEEICCDALVLSRLEAKPRSYAAALVDVIESIAFSPGKEPALASGINNGKVLERRLRMIVSKQVMGRTPRWSLALLFLVAFTLLPTGLTVAQEETAPTHEPIKETHSPAPGADVPLRTVLKTLSYASAQDVMDRLLDRPEPLLSEQGSLQVDYRTNTLILREVPGQLDKVLAVIQEYDVVVPAARVSGSSES